MGVLNPGRDGNTSHGSEGRLDEPLSSRVARKASVGGLEVRLNRTRLIVGVSSHHAFSQGSTQRTDKESYGPLAPPINDYSLRYIFFVVGAYRT